MTAKKLTKRDGAHNLPLGPDVSRHLRLSGLDHQRLRDVQRRPVLQHRLRRRGLLQRAHDLGAVRFIDALVHKWKVMPEGVTDANAVTTAFFQGRTAMMVLSTGSLSFVRENMKTPYRVAFLPRALVNAAPIGGASLIVPKGNSPERQAAAWTLVKWLVSPEIAGGWSRFTGYFAPRIAAYDLPEMKEYMAEIPRRQGGAGPVGLMLAVGSPLTTRSAVRKALEDGCRPCCRARPRRRTPWPQRRSRRTR